ncbi:PorV/PorQ family protein [bacterium]|nr:PorV/PorQ family protein [bacterium]
MGDRWIRWYWVLVALLAAATPAMAGGINRKAGTNGLAFLKIDVGTRAVAMGRTMTAIPDGIGAVYGNPAGLLKIHDKELSFTHNEWLADINYSHIGYGLPLTDRTAIALSASLLDFGKIEGRDLTGFRTGTVRGFDQLVGFTLAYRRSPKMGIGMTGKAMREKLDEDKAKAVAFDFGMIYQTDLPGLFIGATVQNLGSRIKFVQQVDPLPFTYRLGAAWNLQEWRLQLGADLLRRRDSQTEYNVGLEYRPIRLLGLRAGYSSENDLDNGLTAGFGVDFRALHFDYAYVPYGVLGNTHRMTLTFRYGRN